MTNLEWALEYLRLGLSPIPVAKDKKPLVQWKNFMTIPATPDQIQSWWLQWPDANVGIVTGQMAGITAVDVDNKAELRYVKGLVPATVPRFTTGRGGQYLFKWSGESNTVKVNGKDIDIRGEGGFSVAPESTHGNGSVYKWIVPFVRSNLTEVPAELKPRTVATATATYAMTFEEGTRDNDLFHVAVGLRKGGMPKDECLAVLVKQGASCTPPVDEETCRIKVESAYKNVSNSHTSTIYAFLADKRGNRYLAREIQSELGIQGNVYQELKRLVDRGQIITEDKKYFVPGIAKEVDPFEVCAKSFNILFPFGISDFSRIAQGDVVLVAGTKNSGKSAFLAETAIINMKQTKIRYIITENVRKIGERFLKWGFDADTIRSRMTFLDARARRYDSVIDPDALNILDYYNPAEGEYSKVAVDIENMARRLDTGVLVMGIQQRADQDFARGGALSEELAQLVIQLRQEDKTGENRINRVVMKMIKEEAHRHGGEGKSCQYTFSNHASGSRPQMIGDWEWESKKRAAKAGIPEIGGSDDRTRGELQRDMPQLW